MKYQIYFAHSRIDYGTEYELNCLNKIKELYPTYEIVNPRDVKINSTIGKGKTYEDFMTQMRLVYFPIIKECVLLIAVPTSNHKLSGGVMKEVQFALSNNIKVSNLDINYPIPNRII